MISRINFRRPTIIRTKRGVLVIWFGVNAHFAPAHFADAVDDRETDTALRDIFSKSVLHFGEIFNSETDNVIVNLKRSAE